MVMGNAESQTLNTYFPVHQMSQIGKTIRNEVDFSFFWFYLKIADCHRFLAECKAVLAG